ncbi:MAG: MarR family winged helix-turn-helix transcriptional regulator [Planctomycetota bacterium]|jgi:DNA-binding MarR family transcriptional regulator
MAKKTSGGRSMQEALKQSKPFPSTAIELLVNLYRTTDDVAAAQKAALREFELSPAQFNVLRILAGAGPDGHRVAGIGERLVTREPDVTRLVDGLKRRELVDRTRSEEDRRVVRVTITPAGRKLMQRASAVAEKLADQQFAHVPAKDQQALIRLLTLVRSAPDA